MAGTCVKVNCCGAISRSTLTSAVYRCAGMTNELSLADVAPAEKCQNMVDVRAGVDAIDAALIALLARRFDYMDAAARIKTERGAVRDEARKQEVISNVTRLAVEQAMPVHVIRDIWDLLVEGSIAHELILWDQMQR
jgi:isochorismate pyruvate lyase